MPIYYNILKKGWIILSHLFLCVLLFTLTRLGFYFFNSSYFQVDNALELVKLTFYGWRFDISALSMVLGLPFLLLALPFNWNKKNSKLWSWIFLIFIGIALCFEIADWKYFAFNQRRSNMEVLHMISRPSDFFALLPGFFKDYSYLFIIAIGLLWGIYKCSRWIFNKHVLPNAVKSKSPIYAHLLLAVLLVGLVAVGVRGGAQLVPLSPRNAIQYTSNENTPIVLNTTFNIITSVQSQSLERLSFYTEQEIQAHITTLHEPKLHNNFKAKNVVVIILESFSKEFTGLSGGKSYTPFLDSLAQHSFVFTNAYANAFQSAQAIPAILAGIPGWMDQSFMTSAYANNRVNSLASLLSPYGYTSTFYHGATNGSMSFDIFTKNAGYQRYFGRKEYDNELDYDGNWGIWDEPFLQRVAQDMVQTKGLFHAAIFNLNSHPPYIVPKKYAYVFAEEGLEIYKAVRYSDYALKVFFQTAAQQDWFKNTIFLITADHCSPLASNEFYQNHLGKFQIPMYIFDPSQTIVQPGSSNNLVQQIDILPTLIDTLGINKPYYALGKNMWTSSSNFMLTKIGDNFYALKDSLQFNFSHLQLQGMYLFPQDSINSHNLKEVNTFSNQKAIGIEYFKMYLQRYNNDMIDNKMSITP